MQIYIFAPHYFSAITLFLFCINCFYGISQNDKALKDSLNRLDTTAFKSKAFLNNAVRLQKLFDPFREKPKK